MLGCRGVRIVAAAAGEKHSLALATHGAVYSWGCGRHGQLGVPEVVHFQQNNPGVQPAMHTPQFVRALDPILMEPWDRSALHYSPTPVLAHVSPWYCCSQYRLPWSALWNTGCMVRESQFVFLRVILNLH